MSVLGKSIIGLNLNQIMFRAPKSKDKPVKAKGENDMFSSVGSEITKALNKVVQNSGSKVGSDDKDRSVAVSRFIREILSMNHKGQLHIKRELGFSDNHKLTAKEIYHWVIEKGGSGFIKGVMETGRGRLRACQLRFRNNYSAHREEGRRLIADSLMSERVEKYSGLKQKYSESKSLDVLVEYANSKKELQDIFYTKILPYPTYEKAASAGIFSSYITTHNIILTGLYDVELAGVQFVKPFKGAQRALVNNSAAGTGRSGLTWKIDGEYLKVTAGKREYSYKINRDNSLTYTTDRGKKIIYTPQGKRINGKGTSKYIPKLGLNWKYKPVPSEKRVAMVKLSDVERQSVKRVVSNRLDRDVVVGKYDNATVWVTPKYGVSRYLIGKVTKGERGRYFITLGKKLDGKKYPLIQGLQVAKGYLGEYERSRKAVVDAKNRKKEVAKSRYEKMTDLLNQYNSLLSSIKSDHQLLVNGSETDSTKRFPLDGITAFNSKKELGDESVFNASSRGLLEQYKTRLDNLIGQLDGDQGLIEYMSSDSGLEVVSSLYYNLTYSETSDQVRKKRDEKVSKLKTTLRTANSLRREMASLLNSSIASQKE